jgi:hypothetical protein
VSNMTSIANRGYLMPGGVRTSESLTGQANWRLTRRIERVEQCGSGAWIAAAGFKPLTHVQAKVQTTPITDFPTGVPPSAPARRT